MDQHEIHLQKDGFSNVIWVCAGVSPKIARERSHQNPKIVLRNLLNMFFFKGIHRCVTSIHPPFFITWFPRPGHIFGGPNGTPGFAIVDMCSDLKRDQGWKDGCLLWFFWFWPPRRICSFSFLWWVEFTLRETWVWFVFASNLNVMRCGLDDWRFVKKQTKSNDLSI